MKIFSRIVLVLIASVLLFVGCSNKDNQSAEQATPEVAEQETLPPGHPGVGELKYTAPEGWITEAPASEMRRAQFRWPGVEGSGDAILAVFYFPGTGGTVEANLNRWYSQFKQSQGSATKMPVERAEKEVNGMKVTLTYVMGTYLQPQNLTTMSGPVEEKPNYAMLAAIVETPQGPWFFKAIGPQKTIDYWRDSFEKFVDTFKYE